MPEWRCGRVDGCVVRVDIAAMEEEIPESAVGIKQCAVVVAQMGAVWNRKVDANAPSAKSSMNLESRLPLDESSPGLAAIISQQLYLLNPPLALSRTSYLASQAVTVYQ